MWIFLCNDIIIIGDSIIKVSMTNNYRTDPEAVVIMVILNVISIYLLSSYFFTVSSEITDVFSFFQYLVAGGLMVWGPALFISCCIYVLYSTITNIKEYDDILIFSDVVPIHKRRAIYNFYDVYGKKYACVIEGKQEFVHKKYYKVRRCKYEIKYILGVSNKKFSVSKKENKSFWFTWYLPGGSSIDNIFLLPILYVMGLTGLSLIIQGIVGIVVSMFFMPVYALIVVDLWYKFKNK